MRQLSFAAVALAGLMMCAGTARAQSANLTTVKIPFSFLVGDQLMPAGKYVVERTAPDVLLIHGDHGNKSASYVFFTTDPDSRRAGSQPLLTFTKDEAEWRLASIDEPPAGENFVLEGAANGN